MTETVKQITLWLATGTEAIAGALIAIAEARPRSERDLMKVQGLGRVKADKYGEQVLAIVATEDERSRAAS